MQGGKKQPPRLSGSGENALDLQPTHPIKMTHVPSNQLQIMEQGSRSDLHVCIGEPAALS